MFFLRRTLHAFFVVLVLSGTSAAQAQIYVDKDASGANDGSSWADAYTDLQTAIDNADGSSELWVAEGVYRTDSQDDSFTITDAIDGVKVYGGFESGDTFSDRDPGAHPTVLSGDIDDDDTVNGQGVTVDHADISGTNSYTVLFLEAGGADNITSNTVLDGLTITGGQADNSAGTTPERNGGGIFCDGRGSGEECSPTIQNVIFAGNAADIGGAIYNAGNSNGIASPTLVNGLFRGNAALNQDGGAMYNTGLNGTTSPTITNVTFVDNEAADNGGAIFNNGESGGTADPQITNTILWGNTAVNGGDQMANFEANPTLANTIIEGGIGGIQESSSSTTDGGGNLDQDPVFSRSGTPEGPDGGLATVDDGLAVLPGSPALDAGDDAALPNDIADLDDDSDTSELIPFDLAGTSRVQNGTVDIGAYEGTVEPQVLRVDASSSASTPDGLSWSTAYANLQTAIDAAVKTDELWVAEGTYTPASASDSLVITGDQDGLELYGGFSGGGRRAVPRGIRTRIRRCFREMWTGTTIRLNPTRTATTTMRRPRKSITSTGTTATTSSTWTGQREIPLTVPLPNARSSMGCG